MTTRRPDGRSWHKGCVPSAGATTAEIEGTADQARAGGNSSGAQDARQPSRAIEGGNVNSVQIRIVVLAPPVKLSLRSAWRSKISSLPLGTLRALPIEVRHEAT